MFVILLIGGNGARSVVHVVVPFDGGGKDRLVFLVLQAEECGCCCHSLWHYV